MSSRTILHYYRCLSVIFNSAVEDELIERNPCDKVPVPKVGSEPANFLDDEQAEKLIELVRKEKHPFDVIIIVLLHTGMRRGECCGLDWSDIDFRNSVIKIHHSLLYLPKIGVYEDSPKNETSKRVIRVGEDLLECLKEYKEWQESEAERLGSQWINSGKVFTAWNGKPINPGTVTAWFHKFVIRNDLPYVSIHSLRHRNTPFSHRLTRSLHSFQQ